METAWSISIAGACPVRGLSGAGKQGRAHPGQNKRLIFLLRLFPICAERGRTRGLKPARSPHHSSENPAIHCRSRLRCCLPAKHPQPLSARHNPAPSLHESFTSVCYKPGYKAGFALRTLLCSRGGRVLHKALSNQQWKMGYSEAAA